MMAWRTGRDTGRNGLQVILVLLLLLALGLGIGISQAMAAPPGQSAEDGQALFQRKCAACHSIGQGDMLGPDLKGVTIRRDGDWLARFVAAPNQVIASGDPIATELLSKFSMQMPNLGLTEMEVAALIAYLKAQDGAAPELQPTAAPGATEATTAVSTGGDEVRGKALFTGDSRFQNGGPPCLACHSIVGIGALGGGALGPDLTGTHSKLGDAMVTWPENVAPMSAIYSEKPLTEQERTHLLAFFSSGSPGQRPSQAIWQLAGLAVAGVVAVVAVVGIVWRRRLSQVRRPMVARRTSPYRNILGG